LISQGVAVVFVPGVKPENEGVGIFKTPRARDAAPLPVVVRDWTGTWVVDGVPEMSENAGCD
jgi:hypothetical protein